MLKMNSEIQFQGKEVIKSFQEQQLKIALQYLAQKAITQENRIIGSTQEKEEIEDSIYAALKNSVSPSKNNS